MQKNSTCELLGTFFVDNLNFISPKGFAGTRISRNAFVVCVILLLFKLLILICEPIWWEMLRYETVANVKIGLTTAHNKCNCVAVGIRV